MMPMHARDLKTGEKICPSCGHRTPRLSVEEAQQLVVNGTFFDLEDAMTKGQSAKAAQHWEAEHSGEQRPEEGWPFRS